jgi:hypothetical protein
MASATIAQAHQFMYEWVKVKDQINKLAASLLGTDRLVFRTVSHALPTLIPSELGFIRSVSWLYVHYNEVGRVSTGFLIEKAPAFGYSSVEESQKHSSLVVDLRTYLQHNLDVSEKRDRRIQDRCEDWIESSCGTHVPTSEEDWCCCLVNLQRESIEFLKMLLSLIRSIQKDEYRAVICSEWNRRIDNYHPPHEFDQLIAETANDMGREALDPVKLRKRHYDNWRRELDLLRDGYEFKVEARKLVEHALLMDAAPILSITGTDLIRELGISPGPRVGELLGIARRIADEEPLTRAEMIQRLRDLTDASAALDSKIATP